MSTGRARYSPFLACTVEGNWSGVVDLRQVIHWRNDILGGGSTAVFLRSGHSLFVNLPFEEFTKRMLEHEQGRQGENPGASDAGETLGERVPVQGGVGGGSPLPTPVFCSKCMYPYHTGPCHSSKGTCPECGSSLSYLTHRMGCSRSK